MSQRRDFTTPIEMDEKVRLPKVWLVVIGIVAAGLVVHSILWLCGITGLMIWPFIWAVCVLLIVSDAAESTGAGIAPTAAYLSFFGTLIGMFVFVILISKTVNPYLLIALVIGAAIYLAKDWKQRWQREREIQRRRAAHLCLRCMEPVSDGIEDVCENCGLPVNPERMNLFRLGKAMQNKDMKAKARQTLTGTRPNKADAKFAAKQQARAASYRKKK